MTRVLVLLLVLSVTILAGCGGGGQMLVITTNPPGAEVYLRRSGHIEYEGSVAGTFNTSRNEGHFEEPGFNLIGNGPLEYKFDLSKTERASHLGGAASERTTYVYDWGEVRVVAPGYKPALRRVEFSGEALELDIVLQPE